jgi:hypothetical protein
MLSGRKMKSCYAAGTDGMPVPVYFRRCIPSATPISAKKMRVADRFYKFRPPMGSQRAQKDWQKRSKKCRRNAARPKHSVRQIPILAGPARRQICAILKKAGPGQRSAASRCTRLRFLSFEKNT